MKKILTIFLALILIISACGKKGEETISSAVTGSEITPLIVTKVLLKDTLLANRTYASEMGSKEKPGEPGISYDGNPSVYLDKANFVKLKEALWGLVKNPNSKVFLGVNGGSPDWSKPASKKEIRERMIVCDSIQQSTFDAEGNEILTSTFACDSTTYIEGISSIYFYETWRFNKENGMIEREVLGYSVFQYIESKQSFRQLFYVFKSEEAFKKTKQNYSEL